MTEIAGPESQPFSREGCLPYSKASGTVNRFPNYHFHHRGFGAVGISKEMFPGNKGLFRLVIRGRIVMNFGMDVHISTVASPRAPALIRMQIKYLRPSKNRNK